MLNSTSTTFCTADDTTYATGSKDTLGIGNGGWQCNHDKNVNSKIDIMNAYVAQYTTADGAQDLLLRDGEEQEQRHQRRRRLVPAGRCDVLGAERSRQLHRGAPGRRHAGRLRVHVRRRGEHDQGLPVGGGCAPFPFG